MTLVLDAGALIAHERRDGRIGALLLEAKEGDIPLVIPAGVVAQVWRNGHLQARIARLLKPHRSEVVALDMRSAKAVGRLLRLSHTTDVVDASVVWCAHERNATVVTSDPDDLRRIDHRVRLETV